MGEYDNHSGFFKQTWGGLGKSLTFTVYAGGLLPGLIAQSVKVYILHALQILTKYIKEETQFCFLAYILKN